jgi:hypothetical protein
MPCPNVEALATTAEADPLLGTAERYSGVAFHVSHRGPQSYGAARVLLRVEPA